MTQLGMALGSRSRQARIVLGPGDPGVVEGHGFVVQLILLGSGDFGSLKVICSYLFDVF